MFEMPVEIKSRPGQAVLKSQPMVRKRSKSSSTYPVSAMLYDELFRESEEGKQGDRGSLDSAFGTDHSPTDCKRYNEAVHNSVPATRTPSPMEPAPVSLHIYNNPLFLRGIQYDSPPREEPTPRPDSPEPVWGSVSTPVGKPKRAKLPARPADSKDATVPAPPAPYAPSQQPPNTLGFHPNGNSQLSAAVHNAVMRNPEFVPAPPVQPFGHPAMVQQEAYAPPMQQYGLLPVMPPFVPSPMQPMGHPSMQPTSYYPMQSMSHHQPMQPVGQPQFVPQYGPIYAMPPPAPAPQMPPFGFAPLMGNVGPAGPMQQFFSAPMMPPYGLPQMIQQHGHNLVMPQCAPPMMPHVSLPRVMPPSQHPTQSLASDGHRKSTFPDPQLRTPKTTLS